MYKNYVKRFLDIVLAVVALPFVGIVFIFFAPAIFFDDKGDILYKAKRRGKNGKVFYMFKFRSMKMNSEDIRNDDGSTFNSKSDPRVTRVGKIMRLTSIDELPQILNVLKGDMSWIGPRASIPKEGYEWDDLTEAQQKRLSVKPGITGYTAALYRNSITKEEKVLMDCYYVDHISFVLDMKIVLWTIKSVLLRKNIYTN